MYRYKKTKKKISVGSKKGDRYVLAMATEGKIKSDELCEFIKRNSSISEQDIKILMRTLAEIVNENIEIGRGVNLEELGVFLPNIKSTGVDTANEVTADNIEQVVVNFRPSTKFRRDMENAKLREATKYNLKHE